MSVRLQDLEPGEAFEWCGVPFTLVDHTPIALGDGDVGRAVKYAEQDYNREPPRWLRGTPGLMPAETVVDR